MVVMKFTLAWKQQSWNRSLTGCLAVLGQPEIYDFTGTAPFCVYQSPFVFGASATSGKVLTLARI